MDHHVQRPLATAHEISRTVQWSLLSPTYVGAGNHKILKEQSNTRNLKAGDDGGSDT